MNGLMLPFVILLYLTCLLFLLGVISSHVFNGLEEARARHGDCSGCTQCSCCYLLLYSDVGMVSQGRKDCHWLPNADKISVVHMWQRGQCFLCCDFGCLHLVAHLLQGMSLSKLILSYTLYSKVFTSENESKTNQGLLLCVLHIGFQ